VLSTLKAPVIRRSVLFDIIELLDPASALTVVPYRVDTFLLYAVSGRLNCKSEVRVNIGFYLFSNLQLFELGIIPMISPSVSLRICIIAGIDLGWINIPQLVLLKGQRFHNLKDPFFLVPEVGIALTHLWLVLFCLVWRLIGHDLRGYSSSRDECCFVVFLIMGGRVGD